MSVGILLTQPSSGSSGSSTLQLYSENPVAPSSPVAAGVNSVAIGSAAVSAADNAIALGNQSYARHYGGLVFSNGRFGSLGDSQSGEYLLRAVSINALPTELYLDGPSGTTRLVLPDDCTWTFRITVTAHRTDATDGHAGYYIDGVIYRQAGAATTSFLGSPVKTVLAESNPQFDINISADTINGALKIVATGQTGKTIRWLARVVTLEITN